MDKGDMKSASIHIYTIHLRAVVLALGESADPPWWKSKFMSKTGLSFLERLYPRSQFNAQVNAAGKAACEVHDKAVGRVGAYHLFRLPESLEMRIHAFPFSKDEEFFNQFRLCLDRYEDLLEILFTLSSGQPCENNISGPKRIIIESDDIDIDSLGIAASIYLGAFKIGKPAFPYFTMERDNVGG
jgi:hypothetical protein